MITTGIESVTTGGAQPAVVPSKEMDRDAFLNLLITQLQNQDPLNPTDSTEFTAQLAQFSSLEQLTNVNKNLELLQNFQASINNSQAVSLIGKEITANGNLLELTGGRPAGCDFKLDEDAAVVVASIYDHTGGFVTSFEGQNLTAGQHTLYWDGTDKNGNSVTPGNYTFEILAADTAGNNIQTTTFFSGIVNKVIFENNTTYLISGGQKVALGDVIQVTAPENMDEDPLIAEQNNPLINGGK
jgi:flagellar basal-body rod modification protein FlgD